MTDKLIKQQFNIEHLTCTVTQPQEHENKKYL